MRGRERMKTTNGPKNIVQKVLAAAGVLALLSSVGCQVSMNGQTLPSPYYLTDDIQYYAPGPEFKLQNEADALKAANAEAELKSTR